MKGEREVSITDLSDLTSVFVDPTAYADEARFHAACRVLRREHPVVTTGRSWRSPGAPMSSMSITRIPPILERVGAGSR